MIINICKISTMLRSLLILLIVWKTTTGLICYTCSNEPSFDACTKRGSMRRCLPNEMTCHTEVLRFMRPQGVVYSISKRCKQADACNNNEIQNPRAAWKPSQCNLKFPSSVCRCCCNTDRCNVGGFYCVVGPSCSRIPVIEQNGLTKCTLGRNQESICHNTCDPEYELFGDPVFKCDRVSGKLAWNITAPAACLKTKCNLNALKIEDGYATCTNENNLGSICEFSCKEGYTLQNGWPVTSCNSPDNVTDVRWDSDIPTCARVTCLDLKAPENGFLKCTNGNRIGSKCTTKCKRGFKVNPGKKSICGLNKNLLPPVWNVEAKKCEPSTCFPTLLPPMDGTMSCTDENRFNSVCSVKCNPGFVYDGSPTITCTAGLKKRKMAWDGVVTECNRNTCIIEHSSPRDGNVKCSNKNQYGSVCEFTCSQGFKIIGNGKLTCAGIGKPRWSSPAPTCTPIKCSMLSLPHGSVVCTNNNMIQSNCRFVCNEGYKLDGASQATCNRDGNDADWSKPTPRCRAMACPRLSVPNNGEMSCTKGMNTTSVCSFSCNEPYELNPEGDEALTCLNDETWDRPKPCCLGSCPPNAQVDLIIIIDSSSSIGTNNFNLVKNFVKSIVREFTVDNEATKFGIFRYNQFVDTQSEIKLNSYNSVTELLQKIDRIPYNGVGTMTGKALQHALGVSLHPHNGNRLGAPDGILLITDGVTNAGDDFETPAKGIRDKQIGIFAAFIPPEDKAKRELGIKQLTHITGSRDNMILVNDGFSALMSIHSPVDAFVCQRKCT